MFPDGTEFYLDSKNGDRGYNTDPARGADTFCPFSNLKYLSTPVLVNMIAGHSDRSDSVTYTVPTGINRLLVVEIRAIYDNRLESVQISGTETIEKIASNNISSANANKSFTNIYVLKVRPGQILTVTYTVNSTCSLSMLFFKY